MTSPCIESGWYDWVEQACAAVGIDPESVDIPTVHALSTRVESGLTITMAPVGAYILGVAVGHLQEQGRAVDMDGLRQAIEATTRDPRQHGGA